MKARLRMLRAFFVALAALLAASSLLRAQPFTTNYVLTTAFTADTNGPYGYSANNSGLNIGHSFNITGTNLEVFSLGVYNYGGGGLNQNHVVQLMTNNDDGTYSPIQGGNVTVQAGTNTLLTNAYCYQDLPAPVTLGPGDYAVIAFNMTGWPGSDAYSDGYGTNNGFDGIPGFTYTSTVFEFLSYPATTFPAQGGTVSFSYVNYGCASFLYTPGTNAVKPVDSPVVTPPFNYVNAGGSATLAVNFDGSLPVYYQWCYGPSQIPIPGATNSTLVLTNIQMLNTPGNQGIYSVSVSNIASGPVFNTVSNQGVVAVIPPTPPLTIMPLGDSITMGYGAPGGYRAPLYTMLVNAGFNVNFVGTLSTNAVYWLPQTNHEGNAGFRLDNIYDGIPYWMNDVGHAPDVVLLLAGINDYYQGYDLGNATNRLDSLILWLYNNNHNTKIFVANLIITGDPTVESEVDQTYNPFVPIIVANHAAQGQQVYFVDLHSYVPLADLLPDGIHPIQPGYNIIATNWFNAIASVITPSSVTPSLSVTSTNVTLTYQMYTGATYVTQRSTNLLCGLWVPIGTNTISTNGVLQVIDNFPDLGGTPPPAAYYKLTPQ